MSPILLASRGFYLTGALILEDSHHFQPELGLANAGWDQYNFRGQPTDHQSEA